MPRPALPQVNGQGWHPGRLCLGLTARVGAQAVDQSGLGLGFRVERLDPTTVVTELK